MEHRAAKSWIKMAFTMAFARNSQGSLSKKKGIKTSRLFKNEEAKRKEEWPRLND